MTEELRDESARHPGPRDDTDFQTLDYENDSGEDDTDVLLEVPQGHQVKSVPVGPVPPQTSAPPVHPDLPNVSSFQLLVQTMNPTTRAARLVRLLVSGPRARGRHHRRGLQAPARSAGPEHDPR